MRLRKLLSNSDGFSMISVLVAFVILLIGIAGFSRAVSTANNMVRRSEMLNTATGEVLEMFYPEYADAPVGENYVLNVYETDASSGAVKGLAFKLHGRPRVREYDVNITPSGGGEAEPEITYPMYFYK